MMQGMPNILGKGQDLHQSEASPVSNLLETAGNMLKNGATSDVVEFVNETLHEIISAVIPAIEDAHDQDQALINSMWDQFDVAMAALEQANLQIQHVRDERGEISDRHKHCRVEEDEICQEKRRCDYDLFGLWRDWVEEETEIRSIEGHINGHFCQTDADGHYNANGTLATFRSLSVGWMSSFIDVMHIYRGEVDYDEKRLICEELYLGLDTKTDDCDAQQDNLENSACAHAEAVRTAQAELPCLGMQP